MTLVENYENTFYLLGSAVGPHPYPNDGEAFPIDY